MTQKITKIAIKTATDKAPITILSVEVSAMYIQIPSRSSDTPREITKNGRGPINKRRSSETISNLNYQ